MARLELAGACLAGALLTCLALLASRGSAFDAAGVRRLWCWPAVRMLPCTPPRSASSARALPLVLPCAGPPSLSAWRLVGGARAAAERPFLPCAWRLSSQDRCCFGGAKGRRTQQHGICKQVANAGPAVPTLPFMSLSSPLPAATTGTVQLFCLGRVIEAATGAARLARVRRQRFAPARCGWLFCVVPTGDGVMASVTLALLRQAARECTAKEPSIDVT